MFKTRASLLALAKSIIIKSTCNIFLKTASVVQCKRTLDKYVFFFSFKYLKKL